MVIERIGSDSPWEEAVGYSRAVRAGPLVVVSGTTAATADGAVIGGSSLYEQAREALARVLEALGRLGARPHDVVQTRLYVTDIARHDEAARAHAEIFGEIRPAAAMLEVSGLIDPRLLVEVEALAWVQEPSQPVTT